MEFKNQNKKVTNSWEKREQRSAEVNLDRKKEGGKVGRED